MLSTSIMATAAKLESVKQLIQAPWKEMDELSIGSPFDDFLLSTQELI